MSVQCWLLHTWEKKKRKQTNMKRKNYHLEKAKLWVFCNLNTHLKSLPTPHLNLPETNMSTVNPSLDTFSRKLRRKKKQQ